MESTNPAALQPSAERMIREAFGAQPYLRQLGARIASLALGRAELTLPFRAELAQADGAFDPGIVATLAENAGRVAAQTMLPAERAALTVEFKVNIMAPGKGEVLIARANVIRSGKTVTVCRADVAVQSGGSETPCATSVITLLSTAR
jgi:uncharacterized protein (TIGR00369 family)